jgi:tetratricopeptide (TPR) repeat protein
MGPAEPKACAVSLLKGSRDPVERSRAFLFAMGLQSKTPAASLVELRADLQAHPEDPLLLGRLGCALISAGDHGEAVEVLVRSIGQRRDLGWTWAAFGRALEALGRHTEALSAYEQAVRLADHDPEAHRNQGRALIKCGRSEEALRCLRRAVSLDPGSAESQDLLGLVYRTTGRLKQARAALEAAIELEPTQASAHHHLGLLLAEGGDLTGAIEHLAAAAKHAPERGPYQRELARAALKARDLGLARRCAARALALAPEDASSQVVMGWVHEVAGHGELAERSYARALDLDPHQISPYYKLACRGVFDDLKAVEGELEHPGRSALEQSELWFAKAEILRHGGRYDDAWRAYAAGNAFTSQELDYDPAVNRKQTGRIIAASPAELFAERGGMGDSNRLPVFVVGMARSGVSLIERALVAHPQALALGEHPGLGELAAHLERYAGAKHGFPTGLRHIDRVGAVRLAADYLHSFERPTRDFECVVDRAPDNFRLLGLLALILPNARIVHVRRDPLDTCVSNWTTHFGKHRCEYSCDLDHLAAYYRDHRRLMDHWREVLPNPWLDVDYEAFVADPEVQLQRMLAFLELSWRDGAAAPDRLDDGSVHGRAVGSWRRFAGKLGPLEQLANA